MKRRILIGTILLVAAFCAALSAVFAVREQRALSEKLIRLHVIANSDTAVDQEVKLRVRDAILSAMDENEWESRQEAERCLRELLPKLEDAANTELLRSGVSQTAQAELCAEVYPTRVYPTFSLPAGSYLSLRVVIGEGKGKNWWCVLYPSICTAATAELAPTATAAGFTEKEVRLITSDAQDVQIKFKLLEWLQSCGLFDRT